MENAYTLGGYRGDPSRRLGIVLSIEVALSTILRRLDCIEQSIRRPEDTSSGLSNTIGDEFQCQSESEHIDDYARGSVEPDAWLSASSISHSSNHHDSVKALSDSSSPVSALQHAADEVQRLAVQHDNSLMTAVDELHIDQESAKSWVKKLMPDIIGLPNVKLEASICVVYYCILYHGCFFHSQSTPFENNSETRTKLYQHCLRAVLAWEPCATGTTTDFVAAFFMVRVAAERFDLELSWTMFRRACQYAESIKLHRLDSSVDPALTGLDNAVLDAGRKGFWELINMDIYFHLIHDKPSAIVGTSHKAEVNLPWLDDSGLQTETENITTLRFLIESRRSFILMEFLQLLEDAKVQPDPELISKTEMLCGKIEALYEQWEITEWVKKMIQSDGQLWTVAGLAMEGYTYIVSMLRHVISTTPGTVGTEPCDLRVSKLPLAIRACRHILDIVGLLLNVMPFMGTVSVTFTVLQAHIPCAYLASNLLYSATPREYQADAVLIERVARGLERISDGIADLAPLVAAIDNLNLMIHDRLRSHTPK
ncbi:unnamed protein product [Clonostachys rosea]|uniref:Transcription factor domain-containing protein n=1 Tax=Bionectria ochroleuca TaxID=29856 RepID=A0ABY6UQJ8_BIOOC|nr:unnamed protein product [Clonostachys rosea]